MLSHFYEFVMWSLLVIAAATTLNVVLNVVSLLARFSKQKEVIRELQGRNRYLKDAHAEVLRALNSEKQQMLITKKKLFEAEEYVKSHPPF